MTKSNKRDHSAFIKRRYSFKEVIHITCGDVIDPKYIYWNFKDKIGNPTTRFQKNDRDYIVILTYILYHKLNLPLNYIGECLRTNPYTVKRNIEECQRKINEDNRGKHALLATALFFDKKCDLKSPYVRIKKRTDVWIKKNNI